MRQPPDTTQILGLDTTNPQFRQRGPLAIPCPQSKYKSGPREDEAPLHQEERRLSQRHGRGAASNMARKYLISNCIPSRPLRHIELLC